MTKSTSQRCKRVLAAACAVVMLGTVAPMQQLDDFLGSTLPAAAEEDVVYVIHRDETNLVKSVEWQVGGVPATGDQISAGADVKIKSNGKLTFKRYNNKGVLIPWSSSNYAESKDTENVYTYRFTMPEHDLYLSHEHNLVVEYSNNVDVLYAGCSDENSENSGTKEIVKIAAEGDVYDPAAPYNGAVKTETVANLPTGVEMTVSDIYYTDPEFEAVAFTGGIFPVGEYYANVDVEINGENYTIYAPFEIAEKDIGDKADNVYDVVFTVAPTLDAASYGQPYTGGELSDAFSVTASYNGVALAEGDNSDGKDFTYEITPPNGQTAYNNGVYTITVTGHGNYTGTRTFTYNINAADVSKDVFLNAKDIVYNAQPYPEATDEEGHSPLGFSVTPNSLANELLEGIPTGKTQVAISYRKVDFCEGTTLEVDKLLKPGVEYSYNEKTYKVENGVFNIAGYEMTLTPGRYMKVRDLGDEPHFAVVDYNAYLEDDFDPTAPTDAGSYIARAAFSNSTGNFASFVKFDDFEITKKPVTVTMKRNTSIYTVRTAGTLTTDENVENVSGTIASDLIDKNKLVKILDINDDAVAADSYQNAGSYTYVIDEEAVSEGRYKNYQFTIANPALTITPLNLNRRDDYNWIVFTLTAGGPGTDNPYIYSGSAQSPTFTLKNTRTGNDLVLGTDYTISGNSQTDADLYTATVTGKPSGNYTGSFTFIWEIRPAQLTRVTVTPASKDYTTGTLVPTTVTVTGNTHKVSMDDDDVLAVTSDYTIRYFSMGDSEELSPEQLAQKLAQEQDDPTVLPGRYAVVATGTGNYTGSKYAVFSIGAASVSPDAFRLILNDDVYDGDAKTIEDFTFSTTSNGTVEAEVVEGYNNAEADYETTIGEVKFYKVYADTNDVLEDDEFLAKGVEYEISTSELRVNSIHSLGLSNANPATVKLNDDGSLTVKLGTSYNETVEGYRGGLWRASIDSDGVRINAISLDGIDNYGALIGPTLYTAGFQKDAGTYIVKYNVEGANFTSFTAYDAFVIKKRPVTVTAPRDTGHIYMFVPETIVPDVSAFDSVNKTGALARDVDKPNTQEVEGLYWSYLVGLEGTDLDRTLPVGEYDIVETDWKNVDYFVDMFRNYDITVIGATYTVSPYDLSADYAIVNLTLIPDQSVNGTDPAAFGDDYSFVFDGKKHGVTIGELRAAVGDVSQDLTLNTDYTLGGILAARYASEPGQPYKVMIEGKGNFTGKISADWEITAGENTAEVQILCTDDTTSEASLEITYDGEEVSYDIHDGNYIEEYDAYYDAELEEDVTIDNIDDNCDFHIFTGNIDIRDADVKVEYYEYDAEAEGHKGAAVLDGDGEPAAPKNAGVYLVSVTVTDKEGNYTPDYSKTFKLTINKETVNLVPELSCYTVIFGDEVPTVIGIWNDIPFNDIDCDWDVWEDDYDEDDELIAEGLETKLARCFTSMETTIEEDEKLIHCYLYQLDNEKLEALYEEYPWLENYVFGEGSYEIAEIGPADMRDVTVDSADIALKGSDYTTLRNGIKSLTYNTYDDIYTLVEGVDYEIIGGSNSTNEAGTYTVQIEGMGKFEGARKVEINVINIGTAKVGGKSVNLAGTLGVTFNITIPEELAKAEGTYVQFILGDGDPEKVMLDNKSRVEYDAAKNRYKVLINLPVAKYADIINVKLFTSEGLAIPLVDNKGNDYTDEGYEYSVKQYIDSMKESTTASDSVKKLVQGMEDYFISVKKFFKYGDYEQLELSEAAQSYTITNFEDYAIETSGTKPTGFRSFGKIVNLGENTSIRININLTDSNVKLSDYTIKVDGKIVTPKYDKSSKKYYVTVDNIPAAYLHKAHTFTISDGTDEYTESYSVLTYAYNGMSQGEDRQTVSKGLLACSEAAREYWNITD